MQRLHLSAPGKISQFKLLSAMILKGMTYFLLSLQDLIGHLLVVDVKKRYDTDDILEHPWIKVCSSGLLSKLAVPSKRK